LNGAIKYTEAQMDLEKGLRDAADIEGKDYDGEGLNQLLSDYDSLVKALNSLDLPFGFDERTLVSSYVAPDNE